MAPSSRSRSDLPIVSALVFMAVILWGLVPEVKERPAAKPRPRPSAPAAVTAAPITKESQSQFLAEMVTVVLRVKPQEFPPFADLLDSVQQGASLEGIYNGLVHSNDYRELERGSPAAGAQTLRVFSEELDRIESELSRRTEYNASSAKPLAMIDPTGTVEKAAGAVSVADYEKLFQGASAYTLRRVLGDAALRVISEKPEGERALWFGGFARRMAETRTDFGLPLRNNADASFHVDWARKASPDLLTWEVLNRLHRLLNQAEAGGTTKT